MYIGDVGQNRWEEVNFEPAGSPGGLNYGWNALEGTRRFSNAPVPDDVVMPFAEYDHSLGCSVTGGYVYRGKKIPALRGVYVYGDFQMRTIWGLRYENGRVTTHGELVKPSALRPVASFAEDAEGELYMLAFDGKIY